MLQDECSNLKLGLKPDYIAEHAPSKSDLRDNHYLMGWPINPLYKDSVLCIFNLIIILSKGHVIDKFMQFL